MNRHPVPVSRCRVEDNVKNSRFIATLGPAPTAEAALALIDAVRAEFPDATHHGYAFVAGPPGGAGAVGCSDDGEPAGTAGRPMLSVLLNSGVGDVAVVVTRYFGGVKLGKGGLARAYRAAAQHALREAVIQTRVETVGARVTFPYSYSDAVRRVLAREGVVVAGEAYTDDVTLTLRVPADRIESLARSVVDATSGSARFEPAATRQSRLEKPGRGC